MSKSTIKEAVMLTNEPLKEKAINAYTMIADGPIVIQTDADLTPPGKRRVKVVKTHLSGLKSPPHIRWFVGRKAYRSLALTEANMRLSEEWFKSGLKEINNGKELNYAGH
jgi:hypothetical protein